MGCVVTFPRCRSWDQIGHIFFFNFPSLISAHLLGGRREKRLETSFLCLYHKSSYLWTVLNLFFFFLWILYAWLNTQLSILFKYQLALSWLCFRSLPIWFQTRSHRVSSLSPVQWQAGCSLWFLIFQHSLTHRHGHEEARLVCDDASSVNPTSLQPPSAPFPPQHISVALNTHCTLKLSRKLFKKSLVSGSIAQRWIYLIWSDA